MEKGAGYESRREWVFFLLLLISQLTLSVYSAPRMFPGVLNLWFLTFNSHGHSVI